MFRALLLVAVVSLSGCRQSPAAASRRYVERGNRFLTTGRYPEAAINFRKALQSDPQSGEANYGLGRTEQSRGRVREAYVAYRRAAQLMPRHVEVRVDLADLMMSSNLQAGESGKTLRAKVSEIVSEIEALDPVSADGMRLKGQIALAEGLVKEAAGIFEKGRLRQPDHPGLTLGLVQSLFADRRAGEAESLALEFLGRRKDFLPLYDVLHAYYMSAQRAGDAERIRKTMVAALPGHPDSHLRLAAHYRLTNRLTEMNAVIQQLLATNRQVPGVRAMTGDFYAAQGAWNKALEQFEAGAREETQPLARTAYRKRVARVLATQQKTNEALKMLDATLLENPVDSEAHALKAALLLDGAVGAGIDRAIQEYRLAVEHDPGDPVLRNHLGRAYLKRGRLEEARAQFQEASQGRETYLAPRLGLAQTAMAMGQNRDALRYLDQILVYDAANPNVRILRAAALTAIGSYGEARGELLRLEREFPASSDVRLQLGLLHIATKNYREAEEVFRKLYQPGRTGDLRPLEGLIETYISQAQAGRAVELLQEELRRAPKPGPIHWALASTAVQAGLFDLALEQLRFLIAAEPGSADLHVRLGEVQARRGDRASAIQSLERARALAPNDPAPLGLLAHLLDLEGRRSEALALHRRALQLKPQDPFAMNNVAYLLAETGGDLNEAMRLAEFALRKLPQQPGFSDTIGLIYLKRNNSDTALHIFSNLAGKHPANPTYRYHLAEALVKKGDRARARVELETALDHQPAKEIEQRIRGLLVTL